MRDRCEYCASDTWHVWSNEHMAWWGPDRCGYSTDIDQAGRYSLTEALSCCDMRDKVDTKHGKVPAEVVVPSREMTERLLAPRAEICPAARGWLDWCRRKVIEEATSAHNLGAHGGTFDDCDRGQCYGARQASDVLLAPARTRASER